MGEIYAIGKGAGKMLIRFTDNEMNLVARAEAAERELVSLRELYNDRCNDLDYEYGRAVTAEAKCDRLQERIEYLENECYRLANNEATANVEVERLRKQLVILAAVADDWQEDAMKAEETLDATRYEYHERWKTEHAECEQLREKLDEARCILGVINDLNGFAQDIGRGALLPPSLVADVCTALGDD